MTSKAIHLHNAPKNYTKFIETLFDKAFGPSKYAYLKESLCGWAPCLHQPPLAGLSSDNPAKDAESYTPDDMDGVIIQETVDAIILEIEVPHLKAESLYLEISGNMLIVRGERMQTMSSDQGGTMARQQPLNYERLVVLPVPARPGEVRARLVGRVVKVNILKR